MVQRPGWCFSVEFHLRWRFLLFDESKEYDQRNRYVAKKHESGGDNGKPFNRCSVCFVIHAECLEETRDTVAQVHEQEYHRDYIKGADVGIRKSGHHHAVDVMGGAEVAEFRVKRDACEMEYMIDYE